MYNNLSGIDRRGFFGALGAKSVNREIKVRPPYAKESTLFGTECPQCSGVCGTVCEEEIIKFGKDKIPYLDFSKNGCTYCVGAHSVIASMAKIPEQTLEELREQKTLSDPKLNALREFTLSVMEHHGWVPKTAINSFQDAGYDQRHLLEVLTILAQKTLSNYYNHIAQTPLDEMFSAMTWSGKQDKAS